MVQAVRILFITPYYFPYIHPRAHRWTSIAEEWAKNGHDIHVICSQRNDLPKTSIHNKVTIHRTGYNSFKEVFYNFFKTKKRRGEPQSSISKTSKRSRLMTFFVWLNEVSLRKIYFPDDAFVWYFPARKKAIRLLKNQQFDAVVSVSLPFTSQLLGLFCKKKFPEIKWLVDIGDPFSVQFNYPLNNHFLYKKLNLKSEKKVFEYADSISVTTNATKELYCEYFPEFEKKIIVIPPLLKTFRLNEEKSNLDFNLDLDISKIHIGYFGSFLQNIREPDSLLLLLEEAFKVDSNLKDKIQVHFFGDIFETFLMKFEQWIRRRRCAG
jgi:glycosyltransferase involved in cell wall biosynthesis